MIRNISELYKKYKPVKEYFEICIHPDEEKLLAVDKEKVSEGFFPKRGYQLKLSVARRRSAINDFKKLGASEESVADLLLHFVESAIKYADCVVEVSESLYTSIGNTYSNALDLMSKNKVLAKFSRRAHNIVEETEYFGYGLYDYMRDLYEQYYES